MKLLWTILRRVGQVLLLPFFIIGIIAGVIVVGVVLIWRAGVVGFHTSRSLLNRGA